MKHEMTEEKRAEIIEIMSKSLDYMSAWTDLSKAEGHGHLYCKDIVPTFDLDTYVLDTPNAFDKRLKVEVSYTYPGWQEAIYEVMMPGTTLTPEELDEIRQSCEECGIETPVRFYSFKILTRHFVENISVIGEIESLIKDVQEKKDEELRKLWAIVYEMVQKRSEP